MVSTVFRPVKIPAGRRFSLAVQSEIIYRGFAAVIKSVEALDESCLACARRGAAVSERIDLTQIEPEEKYETHIQNHA
jgi:hypothetical protein